MTNVLGKSGMQAAMYYLQLRQYVKNPEEFHKNLYAIFNEGATVLEKVIIKELFRKLGIPFDENAPFSFEKYIHLALEVLSTRPGSSRAIER